MTKTVLIFAKPDDVHALVVSNEIKKTYGQKAIILDSADYPKKWELSFKLNNSRNNVSILYDGNEKINENDIAGVWWRRAYNHLIPKMSDPKVQEFCFNESQALFHGWIYTLGKKVINPLSAEIAANRKPLQLYHATKVGLRIPKTIITNSSEEARDFLKQRKDGSIFKILTNAHWQFTETREFELKYLKHLGKLKMAPVIFQEKIQPKEDIRVTIVDSEIFAVSIKTNHPLAKIDWRLDLSRKIAPHTLPEDLQKQLIKLLKALGLRFGAIDLRLTPQDDYVFFEVNPSGQFLFCEIHGNQNISNALAAALLRGKDD